MAEPGGPGTGDADAVVALCINLWSATQRWAHMQRAVATALPGVPLVRQEAVDVRDRSVHDRALPLSPLTRWRMARGVRRLCAPGFLDTLAAVGCSLSHIECWRWLAASPTYRWALILEDDCCLPTPAFPAAWEAEVLPLIRRGGAPPALDFLVLGHKLDIRTTLIDPAIRRGPMGSGSTRDRWWFYGSHCYLLSSPGARRLLDLALPLELHVDHFLALVMNLGLARGRITRVSTAPQCRAHWERGIIHDHLHHNLHYVTPDASVRAAVGVVLAAALVAVCVGAAVAHVVRGRRKRPP